jgi:hypothetical protein
MEEALLDGTPIRVVGRGLETVRQRVDVVLASSRTVEELMSLLHQLRVDIDVIADNGAAIAVRSPVLARCLGATESLTCSGRRWYVASAGAPAPEVRPSMLLGAGYPVRLALSWRCSGLARVPGADQPIPGSDQGGAARTYLEACRAAGSRPVCVAAVGASAGDAALMQAASIRFVVSRPGRPHDPTLLALPGAIPVCAAGFEGWRIAAAQLLENRATPWVTLR